MLSVTADTNIYISALQFRGLPRRLLDMARARVVRLDISEDIFAEVLRVLEVKFKSSPQRLNETRIKLASITFHVTPTLFVDAITAGASDNRILECAVAAKATTSLPAMCAISCYSEPIPIMKVTNFLRLLDEHELAK